jgi:hypothetical protein
MQHLEGSGTPVLYIGRTVFKVNQPDATVLQVYYFTFCDAQHVSGTSTPIIRSLQLH